MNQEHDTSLVETFLPYMADVSQRQAALHELHQTWRLIEASAKMNCPFEARLLLPAVLATRTDLVQLERDLVANMVSEKVRQVLGEAATRAQYALDLLVRNLFERTADVGFLAADLDLCRFVGAASHEAPDRDAARRRLVAYRAKYTVYDDILLLAPDGAVLVQADADAGLTRSSDPLIDATLAAAGYVETFRASDLRPGQARALLYSQTMRDPDSGAAIGVLCLSFRFEHELAAIFDAYGAADMRSNMLLLDADDRVVSSADPLWIAPGVRVPVNLDGTSASRMFAGREYLVATVRSNGFQGYPGPPGWKAQVMAPLDLAFRGARPDAASTLAPRMLQGLLSHAHSFSPALHDLMTSVTGATQAIKRIVWNGKVTGIGADADATNDSRLNPVLDQITETGERSDAAFSQSIQGLYQTVLASSLQAAGFTAQLLVDLLDRSLYERANDCRWWALAGQLRQALAEGDDPAQAAVITALLGHINSLYTVYSRLVVYDRSGRIVAATGAQDVVGMHIGAETLSAVCSLRSEMDHYAQAFGPSPLYDGAPTFVYHAAIRHPERESVVVGGIGIVFDSAVELRNMLASGVAGRAGMHAFLVSPDGRVLCGTDPAYPAGAVLPLERALLDGAAHHGADSGIIAYAGQYCVAACARADGYREFRSISSREQPVLSVLLQSFGALRDDAELAALSGAERVHTEHEHGRDYALFQADGALMALDAAVVIEALPFAQVKRTPPSEGARVGMLDVDLDGGQRHFVWVFDLARLVARRPHTPRGNGQVILVRHGGTTIGLLVDDVHSVQRFDQSALTPIGLAGDEAALSSCLIKANGGEVLIQALDPERILARVLGAR